MKLQAAKDSLEQTLIEMKHDNACLNALNSGAEFSWIPAKPVTSDSVFGKITILNELN